MAYKEYTATNRYMTSTFKGLNCHERVSDGEWTQMLELTADEYPVMKTRENRKQMRFYTIDKRAITYVTTGRIGSTTGVFLYTETQQTPQHGAIVHIRLLNNEYNANVYHREYPDPALEFFIAGGQQDLVDAVDAAMQLGTVYVEIMTEVQSMAPGKPVDAAVIDADMFLATDAGYVVQGSKSVATGDNLRQIVPIGRQLYTNNGVFMDQSLDNVRRTAAEISGVCEIALTNMECEYIAPDPAKPTSPTDGEYYYNSENGGLYQWSASQGVWVSVVESYIEISFVNAYEEYIDGAWVAKTAEYPDLSGIRDGDAIQVTIGGESSSYVVYKVDNTNHALLLNGLISPVPNSKYQTTSGARVEPVTAKRRMPVLDYICEHNNRIWGCRYGMNDNDEFVNEIYTCALGDPLNWFLLEGTAWDSWITSVGEPGPWTGCCECGQYVLFYKEDKVFVVSGTEPSNFGYEALDDFGVQAGSEKSITVIDNYVYYKSQHGIMRIGVNSYPVCISRDLGYDRWTDAIAGTDGRKYYISMAENGARSMYVYDTETGFWTHETEPATTLALMIRYKNNLLAVGAEETTTVIGVDVAYDYTASEAAKALDRTAWAFKDLATRIILAMDLPTLAAHISQTTVDGVVSALETAAENGTYFINVEKKNAYNVEYVYISNEKPVDLSVVQGQYSLSSFMLTRTALTGETYDEAPFGWMAVTGPLVLDLPDEKRIKSIQIRGKSGAGARLNVYASYDENENWTRIRTETTGRNGTFRITWTPEERCGCFRLRFAGLDKTVIYSIAYETEDAGDNVR